MIKRLKNKISFAIEVWKVIQIILYFFVIIMQIDSKYPECSNIQIFWNVVVGAKGQIVIPSEVRKMIDLNPGDSMIVTVKHGKAIWLVKSSDLESFVEMMQEELKRIKE